MTENRRYPQTVFTAEGHRKRLRQRCVSGGFDALSEYEKLEFLLTFSIPRRNTKTLAKMLLHDFGSIDGVLRAETDELRKVKGIGNSTVVLLKMLESVCGSYLLETPEPLPPLKNTLAVAEFSRENLNGIPADGFGAILLNRNRTLVSLEIFPEKGTPEQVAGKVFEQTILHNAAALALVFSDDFRKNRIFHDETFRLFTRFGGAVSANLVDYLVFDGPDIFSRNIKTGIINRIN